MTEIEKFDIYSSDMIVKQYKLIGRSFYLMFISNNKETIQIKDAPFDLLLSEIIYRKNHPSYYPLTDKEVIKILESELLYRRKEKVIKIRKKILKNKNIFIYLYNLLKNYGKKSNRIII